MIFCKTPNATPDATSSFRLPATVLAKIDQYCQEQDMTRSQLFRKLIGNFEPIQNMPDQPRHRGWLLGGRS